MQLSVDKLNNVKFIKSVVAKQKNECLPVQAYTGLAGTSTQKNAMYTQYEYLLLYPTVTLYWLPIDYRCKSSLYTGNGDKGVLVTGGRCQLQNKENAFLWQFAGGNQTVWSGQRAHAQVYTHNGKHHTSDDDKFHFKHIKASNAADWHIIGCGKYKDPSNEQACIDCIIQGTKKDTQRMLSPECLGKRANEQWNQFVLNWSHIVGAGYLVSNMWYWALVAILSAPSTCSHELVYSTLNHNTRHQTPGTKNLVPGTSYNAPSAWC